jgi:CxxC motif-containing protein
MIDRLTCLLCPIGCELDVETGGEEIQVRGNQCDQGVDFAAEEVLRPTRNLATSVPLAGTADRMLSVRLSGRVSLKSLFPILAEIVRLRPSPPVRRGDVLIANVCGSGADVIATRTID